MTETETMSIVRKVLEDESVLSNSLIIGGQTLLIFLWIFFCVVIPWLLRFCGLLSKLVVCPAAKDPENAG